MPKPNHPSGKGPAKPKAAAAEPIIPENYVDFAEQLMKENCALITKTKIQNLLRLACDVYNNENRRTEERLLKDVEKGCRQHLAMLNNGIDEAVTRRCASLWKVPTCLSISPSCPLSAPAHVRI